MRDGLKAPLPPLGAEPQALVDVLDRLLDTGVVVDGQIVLSLAGVDLVHVGLRALLASVDRAACLTAARPEGLTAARSEGLTAARSEGMR